MEGHASSPALKLPTPMGRPLTNWTHLAQTYTSVYNPEQEDNLCKTKASPHSHDCSDVRRLIRWVLPGSNR